MKSTSIDPPRRAAVLVPRLGRAVVAAALVGLSSAAAAAQTTKAAPSACAAKLAVLKAGESQDPAADVAWLGRYCAAADRDEAANFLALGVMDGALEGAKEAGRSGTDQARAALSLIDGGAPR